MGEWRPIDTAPNDGSCFLAVKAGVFQVCLIVRKTVLGGGKVWEEDRVCIFPSRMTWNPTHWMQLPEPPSK